MIDHEIALYLGRGALGKRVDGEGLISEIVTSGFRTVSIDVYKGRQNWTAAYRPLKYIKKPPSKLDMNVKHLGLMTMFEPDRYGYRGAIKYGMKAFLGNHGHGLIPNSAIYCGDYAFIAQV